MSDKLLKDGLRTSPKIGGVSVFAEMLFIRLLLATCPLGRCPWNPDWILTHALPNRPRTRPTAIAEALQALLSACLVARYHASDGTAYLIIPNHGQRFKHAVRSQWPPPPNGPPDVEGQTFMGFSADKEEEKRRGEGARGAPETTPTPVLPAAARSARASARPRTAAKPKAGPESFEQWVGRLEREWPGINVRKEITTALKKRGEFERTWFEDHWLPGCGEKVSPGMLTAAPVAIPDEPADWRDTLEQLYPGNAISSDPERTWASVEPAIRKQVIERSKGRAA